MTYLIITFPQVGQEIEVQQVLVLSLKHKIQCIPIFFCIVSLFAEQNELQYAVPGGLIGMSFAAFMAKSFT